MQVRETNAFQRVANTKFPALTVRESEPLRALVVLPEALDCLQAEQVLQDQNHMVFSSRDALQTVPLMRQQRPTLLLIAVGNDGFAEPDLICYLQREGLTEGTAILAAVPGGDVSIAARAWKSGANDIVTLPINPLELEVRVRGIVERQIAQAESRRVHEKAEEKAGQRVAQMQNLLREQQTAVAELADTIGQIQAEMVDALALPAEQYRATRPIDQAQRHLDAVSELCAFFGRGLRMAAQETSELRLASRLHDIGNLYLADRLLTQMRVLDAIEVREWRQHTLSGKWFLSQFDNPVMALGRTIAEGHHERWDGQGFPQQRAGGEIPLPARIVAIAHAIDDLANFGEICDRGAVPSNMLGPVSHLHLIDAILEESGKRFDPALVSVVRERQGELLALLDHLYPPA